jgi:hypothetical protein
MQLRNGIAWLQAKSVQVAQPHPPDPPCPQPTPCRCPPLLGTGTLLLTQLLLLPLQVFPQLLCLAQVALCGLLIALQQLSLVQAPELPHFLLMLGDELLDLRLQAWGHQWQGRRRTPPSGPPGTPAQSMLRLLCSGGEGAELCPRAPAPAGAAFPSCSGSLNLGAQSYPTS